MLRICMVGTGYVGLVSGACLADFGNRVTCVDIDRERIKSIENGVMPIYEPGLKEIVLRNHSAGRLRFSTDIGEAVRDSVVVFSAVGTPQSEDGSCDLGDVFKVAEDVAGHMDDYRIFVQKSTVPVGTSKKVRKIIRDNLKKNTAFDMVSNPEFLREGSAIEDFMRPNRVVIGVDSDRAREVMNEVYRPLYLLETPIVFTTIETAELIKYASNAFLATKISFINEISDICENVEADISDVARAMGLDRRIGPKFLHAGVGYGGSCLPKDVAAIIHTADEWDVPLRIIRAAQEVNESRIDRLMEKLADELGDLSERVVAILGLSFKPNTDDIREAPSLRLIDRLLEAGTMIRTFDPIAMGNGRKLYGDRIGYFESAYEAVEEADALVIMTEWNEFRVLDLEKIKKLMRTPVLIDSRNIYKPDEVNKLGFRYRFFG